MTDIAQVSMIVDGTKDQTATINDGHPGGGRSAEARIAGLQRRRAKGLDDIPGRRPDTGARPRPPRRRRP